MMALVFNLREKRLIGSCIYGWLFLSIPVHCHEYAMNTSAIGSPQALGDIARNNRLNRNAIRAADNFQSILDNPKNINDPALYQLADALQSTSNLQQLAPPTSGDHTTAIESSLSQLNSLVHNLQQPLNTEQQSLESLPKTKGLWIQGIYNQGKQSRRKPDDGFDLLTDGLMAGLDFSLNTSLKFGITVNDLETTTDNSEQGKALSIKSKTAGIYLQFEHQPWRANLLITQGSHHNRSQRYVSVDTITANYNSISHTASFSAGYRFNFNNLYFQPLLEFHQHHLSINHYQEQGSLASLHVNDQNYKIQKTGTGARAWSEWETNNGVIQPYLSAMAFKDWNRKPVQLTSRFAAGGDDFVVTGKIPGIIGYKFQTGISWSLNNNNHLHLGYEYQTGNNYKSDNWQMLFRFNF